ncbi:putative GPI-anchored protein At1g61900 [Wolffia australiana]
MENGGRHWRSGASCIGYLFIFLFFLQPAAIAKINVDESNGVFLPEISPSKAPQPFMPFLAPSPLGPFSNVISPKLSGLCSLNFSAAESMIKTTAIDCWTSLAPFLANVICCPQLHATMTILLGQSSKSSGALAMDTAQANHCLSDLQKLLSSQGANDELGEICSLKASNFTRGSCPIGDVDRVESLVDSKQLLTACKRVDSVNECCTQICQNAITEAARRLALGSGQALEMGGALALPEHLYRVDGCKSIVMRWLTSRLDLSSVKQVLRRISNCNVNSACPLVFPDAKRVGQDCADDISNRTACCAAMDGYVSHLQKQSFITNLQALGCASQLGRQLQEMNISANVYSLCHVTLKDFSLQVGSQESGCLLPSLPSDATFDQFSGISFTCDLNDNIPAPWPSGSELPSSSCNKSITLPALPAATSGQSGEIKKYMGLGVILQSIIILLWFLC